MTGTADNRSRPALAKSRGPRWSTAPPRRAGRRVRLLRPGFSVPTMPGSSPGKACLELNLGTMIEPASSWLPNRTAWARSQRGRHPDGWLSVPARGKAMIAKRFLPAMGFALYCCSAVDRVLRRSRGRSRAGSRVQRGDPGQSDPRPDHQGADRGVARASRGGPPLPTIRTSPARLSGNTGARMRTAPIGFISNSTVAARRP